MTDEVMDSPERSLCWVEAENRKPLHPCHPGLPLPEDEGGRRRRRRAEARMNAVLNKIA